MATGNIKPTGYAESWCTIKEVAYSKWVLMICMLLLLSLILLGFTLIICVVAKTERSMIRAIQGRGGGALHTDYYHRHPHLQRIVRNRQAQQNAIKSMQTTKAVFVQALAYCISYIITLSMPIINQIFQIYLSSIEELSESQTVDKLAEYQSIIHRIMIVLLPLQGFFNVLIFIYHKIYNYRRIHPEVSRYHTLMLVFYGKADDHVLFSRISMVSVNGEESIDINIHNERNEDILLFMDRSGRLEYEQEEDFGSFDEELFVDKGEESRGDLSGFSSLPSNGVSLEIDKDLNVIDGDLKGSSDSVVFREDSCKKA